MPSEHYPPNWPEIAAEIKAACNYVCQECGKQCRRPGEFYLGWEYELTVSHYDHVYDAPEIFCVALCIPCHFLHDCRHSWAARMRWQRLRQRQAGQLFLL